MSEPALIPYGCDSGVCVEVEARLVADHYGLNSPASLIGEAPARRIGCSRRATRWHGGWFISAGSRSKLQQR